MTAMAPATARMTTDDLHSLYFDAPLHEVGRRAHAVTASLHPEDYRTYVVDRNINYANWCTAKCIFCNFKADPPEAKSGRTDLPEGYTLSYAQIGRKIEEHVGRTEDDTARLHDRHVVSRHAVHHQLTDSRIDEDHLDDYDTDDKIGEIQRDDVRDRPDRIGERMTEDDDGFRDAFEPGHLDIRAVQQGQDRRADHPGHIGGDDQSERQDRKRDRLQMGDEPDSVRHVRDAREYGKVAGKPDHQDVADEELGD